LLSDPDDGGRMFRRNIGEHLKIMSRRIPNGSILLIFILCLSERNNLIHAILGFLTASVV
jgi:hypothetical protein